MAFFNLENYETVAERLKRFAADYPDGRIVTDNVTTEADRQRGEWIIKSTIYLTAGDQAAELPKATGYAFERDGTSGANKTSALENAETSSRGRALAVIYGVEASREEMQKVNKAVAAEPDFKWAQRIGTLKTKEEARALYKEANAKNAPKDIKVMIQEAALMLGEAEETTK